MKNYINSFVSVLAVALGLAMIPACSGQSTSWDGGRLPDGASDGGECPITCSMSDECCPGQECFDGVCQAAGACPEGCNWECDRDAGEICDRQSKLCVQGVPPINCVTDCDCFAHHICREGACVQVSDPETCDSDADCGQDGLCLEGKCQYGACTSREDCAQDICLVCKEGYCAAPPEVCQVDQDCCVGFFCNFGECSPEGSGCAGDSDCSPELPQCLNGRCVAAGQECLSDGDCPLAGQQCLDNLCLGQACTAEDCPQGQWCDGASGMCRPGCDSNGDCLPPDTCDLVNHVCGQVDCCGNTCLTGSQVCSPETCQCIAVCGSDSDCPTNYQCRLSDGQCVCTSAACAVGSHCDSISGECVADGPYCDPVLFSGPIQCADSLSGGWTGVCPSSIRQGRYARQFTFSGSAGSFVTIDLVSASDPYLYLVDPFGVIEEYDDDGGDGLDARIVKPLDSTGEYIIEATTSYSGQTGSFQISMTCSDPADCQETILCADTVAGSWTAQCPSSQNWDSYARQYSFEGSERQQVTIDLSSSLDAYLYLIDPQGQVEQYDDDGGSGSDSQIVHSLDMAGTYLIEATTYDSYETGSFSLQLQCLDPVSCNDTLACGDAVSGVFTEDCESEHQYGSYARWFTFSGLTGQQVAIDLSGSADSYLVLIDPQGQVEQEDDDGGAGSDARISRVLDSSGEYTIEATTYYGWTSGAFTLSLDCP